MKLKTLGFSAAGLLIGTIIVGSIMLHYGDEQEITITVKEKYMARGKSDIVQHVTATNGKIYTCDDRFWIGFWDSATVFSRLESGKTYKITTVGYRVPLFSTFRNIVSIAEVKNE